MQGQPTSDKMRYTQTKMEQREQTVYVRVRGLLEEVCGVLNNNSVKIYWIRLHQKLNHKHQLKYCIENTMQKLQQIKFVQTNLVDNGNLT